MGPRFRLRNMLQALIVFCLSLFQRMQILHQLSALQIPSSSLKLIFSIHSLLFRSIHTRTHRYIHVCVCVCPHIIHMLYMCQIVLFVSTLGDTSKPQKATKMLSNTFKIFQNFHFFVYRIKYLILLLTTQKTTCPRHHFLNISSMI